MTPIPTISPLAITLAATTAGALSATALLAYSVFSPRCQFWAPVIRSLPDRESVALTFDDGPHPEFTPQILDILAAHNTPAAFFVIGRHAKSHPALIKRIHAAGHTLGNHTLDHDHFGVNRNLPYWRNQINETQKILADITGHLPLLFRPPMGFKTWHLARAVKEAHLPIIGWSVRTYDTKPIAPETLAKSTLKKTTGHDIILLHDGLDPTRKNASQAHTVSALPTILLGLQQKKLTPVHLIQAILQKSPP